MFDFQHWGPCYAQQIHSVCVNIHSNKIPLTPPSSSGHLKHGLWSHHKFSLSIFRNMPLAHLLPSFGYLSQVLELFTTPLLILLGIDRDQQRSSNHHYPWKLSQPLSIPPLTPHQHRFSQKKVFEESRCHFLYHVLAPQQATRASSSGWDISDQHPHDC